MPHKAACPCKYPGCVHTTHTGYCETHAHWYQPPERAVDTRPSAAARGYDQEWQAIRAAVLRDAGIPPELRPLYDVHHTPEYNPQIDPDHRHYTLTPLLHGEHSRETGVARGRGGKSLGNFSENRRCPTNFSAIKTGGKVKNG
ncbi:MAG: hypothetical protein LBQ88_11010 [Treponema sp.]|jgi:hypothetical protein|nr:hypothetical protein [Treponema sp.]